MYVSTAEFVHFNGPAAPNPNTYCFFVHKSLLRPRCPNFSSLLGPLYEGWDSNLWLFVAKNREAGGLYGLKIILAFVHSCYAT